MIKKLIGIVFSLATLGVIVCAVLGHGHYRSIVWPDGFSISQLLHFGSSSSEAEDAVPTPEQPLPPAAETAAPAAASDPQDAPDEYFEDADDDLPSDLFSEESY